MLKSAQEAAVKMSVKFYAYPISDSGQDPGKEISSLDFSDRLSKEYIEMILEANKTAKILSKFMVGQTRDTYQRNYTRLYLASIIRASIASFFLLLQNFKKNKIHG